MPRKSIRVVRTMTMGNGTKENEPTSMEKVFIERGREECQLLDETASNCENYAVKEKTSE